jgi:2-polyprenyl-6-methoxyphenol hydroxylase-like FAD-dependent oxidoreductase
MGCPTAFSRCLQYDTERILEACLDRNGGSVSRGLTLTEFAQHGARIIAKVRDVAGEIHPIECSWLVGCDGRSTVRKALKLEYDGETYPIGFALGDVELDWEKPRGRGNQPRDGRGCH